MGARLSLCVCSWVDVQVAALEGSTPTHYHPLLRARGKWPYSSSLRARDEVVARAIE